MNKIMNANENEFAADTPENYAHDAAVNGVPEEAQAPVPENLGEEAPAGEATPPAAPVVATGIAPAAEEVPAAPEAPVAPVAPVAEAPANFDRSAAIPGIVDTLGGSLEGKALATKEKLAKEPKVRMMIPFDVGEKGIVYRPVIINGYRFDVRKNMMVDLPQSVAALLTDAYSITTQVADENPLNLNKADGETSRALGV